MATQNVDVSSSIELRELRVLTTVAEGANFSAAARALGLSRADVSRTIAKLERQLDVRLCTRTTRSVVLTDAGREFVRRLRPALDEIGAALIHVNEQQHGLRGPIRLACSHAFARYRLLEPISTFVAQHPSVEIALSLNDRMDDLVLSSLDLAIRIGPLAPSTMVARRVGRLALALVASPSLGFAKRRLSALDLENLTAIGFRVPATGEPYPWRLRHGNREISISATRVAIEADSIEAVADLARLAVGVALLPRYLVEQDLANGTLVEVETKSGRFVGPEVHLCFASRHRMPARVRTLCDYLYASGEPILTRSGWTRSVFRLPVMR